MSTEWYSVWLNPKSWDYIERFKKPMAEDGLSFLIVKDMLLTGFDAPVEQVMYLDRKLKDHSLLQAIARVNRTKSGKFRGYIVDYYGLSDYLAEALEMFTSEDVHGALIPIKEEVPKLEQRHMKVMAYFADVNKRDIDACVDLLEDEEVRSSFEADLMPANTTWRWSRYSRTKQKRVPPPTIGPNFFAWSV